ncbi:MAG: hypothetical protein R2848_01420 [Thermomicrobiales bacterium]
MVEFHSPGRTAPAPACEAQPSVMPSITGVPAGNPVSTAADGCTRPATWPDTPTPGNMSESISSACKTSSGHALRVRSNPDFNAVV